MLVFRNMVDREADLQTQSFPRIAGKPICPTHLLMVKKERNLLRGIDGGGFEEGISSLSCETKIKNVWWVRDSIFAQ